MLPERLLNVADHHPAAEIRAPVRSSVRFAARAPPSAKSSGRNKAKCRLRSVRANVDVAPSLSSCAGISVQHETLLRQVKRIPWGLHFTWIKTHLYQVSSGHLPSQLILGPTGCFHLGRYFRSRLLLHARGFQLIAIMACRIIGFKHAMLRYTDRS